MPFTKQSKKADRDDGASSRLQRIMLLLILSCGITSVAAVDVTGYAFSSSCNGEGDYGCIGLPRADCCGFDGLRPSLSIRFVGVPPSFYSYSWIPLLSVLDCGTIHRAQTGQFCHVAGVRRLTGASWSDGGHFAVSGDGATVSIPRCKNVVKAAPIKVNATSGSYQYALDNES